MLRSAEYEDFAADYRRLTRRYFPSQVLPPRMELRESAALFPSRELLPALQTDYQEQCRRLCYGAFPAFGEVLGELEAIRDCLVAVPEEG